MSERVRSTNHREIISLLSGHFDGGLDDTSRARLESLLASDPAARQTYYRLVQLEAEIGWLGSMGIRQTTSMPFQEQRFRPWARRSLVGLALAGVAATLLIGLFLSSNPTPGPQEEHSAVAPSGIATIIDTDESLWSSSKNPTHLDASLQVGTLVLDSGRATIRFVSGAILTMVGPCSIELLSDRSAELRRGKVSVDIPTPIDGFHLKTPAGLIYDRGTLFGVHVAPKGETEIHVIEGEVEVVRPETPSPSMHRIRVGKAQLIGSSTNEKWVDIECAADEYRRLFPGSLAPQEPGWRLIHEDDFSTKPDLTRFWEVRAEPIELNHPSIKWELGHLVMTDRPILISQEHFDPKHYERVRVAGRWTIVSPNDQPEVVLRTNGVPTPPFGDTNHGIRVGIMPYQNEGVLSIVPQPTEYKHPTIEFARIPFRLGDSYNFEVIDQWNQVMVRVWDANDKRVTASVKLDVQGEPTFSQIALHNRNRVGWPMILHLHHVRIDVVDR
jgi:ferric-dicitrate binding protein FerR (iron transport regulator)